MAWLQLYEHEQQIDTFVLVALPLMNARPTAFTPQLLATPVTRA